MWKSLIVNSDWTTDLNKADVQTVMVTDNLTDSHLNLRCILEVLDYYSAIQAGNDSFKFRLRRIRLSDELVVSVTYIKTSKFLDAPNQMIQSHHN